MNEPISEDICQDCGGDNPVWFAPNELWNEVVDPNKVHFLCPVCFIKRAEAIRKRRAWSVKPEVVEEGSSMESQANNRSVPQTSPRSTESIDDKIYELAKWIVEYEFTSPNARYSSHMELIDVYTMKIKDLIKQSQLEAMVEELEDLLERGKEPPYVTYDMITERIRALKRIKEGLE